MSKTKKTKSRQIMKMLVFYSICEQNFENENLYTINPLVQIIMRNILNRLLKAKITLKLLQF